MSDETKAMLDSTRMQTASNEKIAKIEGDSDFRVAQTQSSAVIKQAELDFKARIKEAESNITIQMEALRVREKEADLQFKVDMKNAENDAVRAEASRRKADADYLSSEARHLKEENKGKRDSARLDMRNDYHYGLENMT